MEPQTLHFQSQAVAMLAMATGAIGFGLFGEEFPVSTELLPTMKLVAGGYAVVCYLMLVRSVRDILESDDVTGLEVSLGPLTNMLLVVFFVVSVFVIGIVDGPSRNPPRDGKEPTAAATIAPRLGLPFSVICYRTQAFPVPCFSAMRWPKVAADSLS